jgi:murein DD-endopeptidase MepM/ murein hydrolase activator NlpD
MKKLLQKDGFYLALFVCVCLIAVCGVWLTNKKVDNLASNQTDTDELHLIQDDSNDLVPTSTESQENLATAKEKSAQKTQLSFIGNEVVREYSEKEPSYSKTLDVWEVHKGLDVSANDGQEIKSLFDGTVVDVFKDDEYGISVKVEYDGDVAVIYSNLKEDVSVKKDDEVSQGQVLGQAGATSNVECEEEIHVHIQAFKNGESIDPMSLIN